MVTAGGRGTRRQGREKGRVEREEIIRSSQRRCQRSGTLFLRFSAMARGAPGRSALIFLLLPSPSASPDPRSPIPLPLSLPFATCAAASKRSNAPASQHGPAPPSCITVSLDLHDLHESPRDSAAYKQTSRTGEKGTGCFSNVSSTAFLRVSHSPTSSSSSLLLRVAGPAIAIKRVASRDRAR